jgi:hypothetical protein
MVRNIKSGDRKSDVELGLNLGSLGSQSAHQLSLSSMGFAPSSHLMTGMTTEG